MFGGSFHEIESPSKRDEFFSFDFTDSFKKSNSFYGKLKSMRLSQLFENPVIQHNFQGFHKVGVLEKRGNKNHNIRNWKKRFFAAHNFTLYYFQNNSNDALLKGSVDLRSCVYEVCERPIDGRPHCFELERVEDGWSIYINCTSKDVLEEWIYMLKEIRKRLSSFRRDVDVPTEYQGASHPFALPFKNVGEFILEDNKKYWGGVHDLQRSGHGILLWPNGDSIIAEWKYDKVLEQGLYERSNKQWKYEGTFQHCKPHGRGKVTLNTGLVWECNWDEGQVAVCSDGIQTNKEAGEMYEGCVGPSLEDSTMPCRRGHGKLIKANGDSIEGCFDESTGQILHGSKARCVFWKTGNEYYGQIHQDQPHGEGKMIYHAAQENSLRSFDGNFQRGKPHGWGIVEYSEGENGTLHELHFNNGELVPKRSILAACVRRARLENTRLKQFLKREKESLNVAGRGKVCYLCNHSDVDVILLGCLHQKICSTCAEMVSKCPECKSPIEGKIKKFLT